MNDTIDSIGTAVIETQNAPMETTPNATLSQPDIAQEAPPSPADPEPMDLFATNPAPTTPVHAEAAQPVQAPDPAPVAASIPMPTPVAAPIPTPPAPITTRTTDTTMNEDNSYLTTLGRIEALKRQAEEQKRNELTPTIERFKKAISVYGISPLDVFTMDQLSAVMPQPEPTVIHAAPMSAPVSAPAVQQAPQAHRPMPMKAAPAPVPAATGGKVVKYTDGRGGTWTGYGRKPQWFIDAVARGVNPQDLLAPGQTPDRVLRGAAPSSPQPQAARPAPVQNMNASGTPSVRAGAGQNPPKYANGQGGTWTGFGRKPQWITQAEAQGVDIRSFLIAGNSPQQGAALMNQQRAVRREAPVAAQPNEQKRGYRLGDHYWTGVGPRPRWFKEAIGSGHTLEELRA
jgi:DNA-binding protein H-NS